MPPEGQAAATSAFDCVSEITNMLRNRLIRSWPLLALWIPTGAVGEGLMCPD
jgi:hypothetical protein